MAERIQGHLLTPMFFWTATMWWRLAGATEDAWVLFTVGFSWSFAKKLHYPRSLTVCIFPLANFRTSIQGSGFSNRWLFFWATIWQYCIWFRGETDKLLWILESAYLEMQLNAQYNFVFLLFFKIEHKNQQNRTRHSRHQWIKTDAIREPAYKAEIERVYWLSGRQEKWFEVNLQEEREHTRGQVGEQRSCLCV